MKTREEVLADLRNTSAFISAGKTTHDSRRAAAYIEGLMSVLDNKFLQGNFVYKTKLVRTGPWWKRKYEEVNCESYPQLMLRLAEKYLSMEDKDE